MTEIIVALIGGLFTGVIGNFLGAWLQRKKTAAEANKSTAEANDLIADTVQKLIEPLNARIEQLEARVKTLEGRSTRYLKRIAYLMDGIRVLIGQIESANQSPCWKPDEWKADEDQ